MAQMVDFNYDLIKSSFYQKRGVIKKDLQTIRVRKEA